MEMINLIPPAHKESIAYARRNSRLVGIMMGILFAVLGAAIITGGSLFYLKQDTSTAKKSIEQSKSSLGTQKEAETLARTKEMSDNLKLAADILSNELRFSDLLYKIGEVMPPGTVLEGISLTNQVFGIGTDLDIGATDYESGSRAYVNLNDGTNKIFDKADLLNISCDDNGREPPYRCIVKIRALFSKDNPLLLVQGGAQ